MCSALQLLDPQPWPCIMILSEQEKIHRSALGVNGKTASQRKMTCVVTPLKSSFRCSPWGHRPDILCHAAQRGTEVKRLSAPAGQFWAVYCARNFHQMTWDVYLGGARLPDSERYNHGDKTGHDSRAAGATPDCIASPQTHARQA